MFCLALRVAANTLVKFRETPLWVRSMTKRQIQCPQCQSRELEQDSLSQKGSQWPILFGRELFKKKELVAYACRDCSFVFLTLGPPAEE